MLLLSAFLLLGFGQPQSNVAGLAALEKAAALVQQGNLAEADQQAQVALADPDTRAAANSVLGTIRLQQNRPRDAVPYLQEAIRLDPRLMGAHLNLAAAHVLTNEPGPALDAYDAALKVQPDSIPALQQAAAIAERVGELERSLSYWIRAKKLQPEDPEILLGFGRVCLRMDLLDDAEPALTRAAGQRPNDPTYQYMLAAAKVGKHQYRFRAAPAGSPGGEAAGRSAVAVRAGRRSLRARTPGRRRAASPGEPALAAGAGGVAVYLALVARDQGDEPKAITALEALLQSHPDHGASCEVLGGLLMSAHRYAEAEGYLRKAVRLAPASVKANYQLGLLLTRMGRKDEAAKQLEVAKGLRKEQEASSRLQLRLLDPDQIVDRHP